MHGANAWNHQSELPAWPEQCGICWGLPGKKAVANMKGIMMNLEVSMPVSRVKELLLELLKALVGGLKRDPCSQPP